MKRVLIAIFSNVSKHPRVLMEVEALRNSYNVFCASVGGEGVKELAQVDISGLYEPDYKRVKFNVSSFLIPFVYRFYRLVFPAIYKEIDSYERSIDHVQPRLLKKFMELAPDVFIFHDINMLPLAKEMNLKGVRTIFNAHEYYPEVLASDSVWERTQQPKVIEKLRKYLSSVDIMFSVSSGIKERYLKEFGKDSILITNAKPFYDLQPVKCDGSKIKLVHHGSSVPLRKLEEMMEVMDQLPENYSLDLFLNPAFEEYHDKLVSKYGKHPRIKFNPTVPTEKLPEVLNQFDIGICFLPPANFNLEMMLPNKFFEFVQARNAIVAGPTTEVKSYMEKYDLGIVTNGYTTKDLADTILSIPVEKINYYKHQCHKNAKALSNELELAAILDSVNALVNNN